MTTGKKRLLAARRHGLRAVTELRHMAADSALYWVLSHQDRVKQFRRAVRGTKAAPAVNKLIGLIEQEATALKRAKPKRRVARRRRSVRTPRGSRWLRALAAQPLPM